MSTPVQGPQGDDKRPKYVDLALAAAQRVFKQFSDKHGVQIDQLGPTAKKVADEMYKLFEAGAKRDGSVLSELVLSAYQQLRHAHDLDQASKFDAGKPPAIDVPSNGQIPTTKFMVTGQDGRTSLEGAVGPDHLLTKLLTLVGLNPKSLSSAAAEVVDGARSSAKYRNLTDETVWAELGRKLRAIAVQEGANGSPRMEQLQRSMKNAAESGGNKQRIDPNLGAVPRQGLGLEQTASRTSNTGSRTNATAIRAQLLAGVKSKDSVDKTAESLAGAILGDMKVGEVSSALKKDVISALKQCLEDPRSPDGSVRPAAMLENAFRLLSERAGEDAPKRAFGLGLTFASALSRAMDTLPPSAGLDKAVSSMALTAMTELVGAVLGQPKLGPSDALMEKLTGVLRAIQKKTGLDEGVASALKEQKKPNVAAETPKKDAANAAQDAGEPKKTQTGRDANDPRDSADPATVARGVLESIGVDPSHPRMAGFVDALKEIYQKGTHPGAVALNGLRWLTQESGMSPKFLEMSEQIIGSYARGIKDTDARLVELEKAGTDYADQKKNSVDKGAIADLDKLIEDNKGLITECKEHRAALEDAFRDARDKALSMVAHFTLNPDHFRSQYVDDGNHGNGNGGGGGDGGGPNGGNGAGGPRDPNGPVDLFPPRDLPEGRLPGVFSPAGPTDTDPAKMTLQQARAMECAKILRDPSLSIEDKIFLFMMMFVAFTDREREEQLEEIVGLDRDQAARAKLKDEKTREKTSMLQEQRKTTDELRDAVAERDALKAGGQDSPDFKAAQKRVDDLAAKVERCKSKVEEISIGYEKIKRESDKAPQSREVKFTELQRLSQLRDNILNMARSMMETSNRNIEKVFR